MRKTMCEYIVRETDCGLATKQEIVGELVRCKDCKWWKELEDVKGLKFCTYVIGAEFVREGIDYCSRGEKERNV